MARKKKKRTPVARAEDAATHETAEQTPVENMKSLQEVDFYTLWNQCKKSPDYDVKDWVRVEAKLSEAFSIHLLGEMGTLEDAIPREDHDDPNPRSGE